jgi:hypothetical protein
VFKVTVLYNLADSSKADAFEAWRTTEHQAENESIPGALATDFYVSLPVDGQPPPYRYITEVYFPDYASLRQGFLAPDAQARVQRQIAEWGLSDFTVIVSTCRAAGAKGSTGPG